MRLFIHRRLINVSITIGNLTKWHMTLRFNLTRSTFTLRLYLEYQTHPVYTHIKYTGCFLIHVHYLHNVVPREKAQSNSPESFCRKRSSLTTTFQFSTQPIFTTRPWIKILSKSVRNQPKKSVYRHPFDRRKFAESLVPSITCIPQAAAVLWHFPNF